MSFYKKYLLLHYTKNHGCGGGRLEREKGTAVDTDLYYIHHLKIIEQISKQFPAHCRPHSGHVT